MSENILIALIRGISSILASWFGVRGRQTHKTKKSTRLARASWAVPDNLKEEYDREVTSKRRKRDADKAFRKYIRITVLVSTGLGIISALLLVFLIRPLASFMKIAIPLGVLVVSLLFGLGISSLIVNQLTD